MRDCQTRRDTPQRRIVLQELGNGDTHPTATELFDKVRRRLPRISLGTVYRNLEVLANQGMIRKLMFGDGVARFDPVVDSHDHVRCVRCGRVDDVAADVDHVAPDVGGRPMNEPARTAGYEILGHRLEYVGVCPACQDRKKDPA